MLGIGQIFNTSQLEGMYFKSTLKSHEQQIDLQTDGHKIHRVGSRVIIRIKIGTTKHLILLTKTLILGLLGI